MDLGGNMFCLNNNTNNNRHQNNTNTFTWDNHHSWQTTSNNNNTTFTVTTDGSSLMFQNGAVLRDRHHHQHHHHNPYSGSGSHVHPDPHLMCLKLGKRHYFEDGSGTSTANNGLALGDKRGKVAAPATVKTVPFTATTVPRCQVEGCHVALLNSKEYHRRHKVCEMHSKAPKVVVLGMEQRFCQQCSRFHAVSEFDDSKRSCRRRLAGHNERRRKSSHDSVARNSSQGGCALSLLSSRSDSWLAPSDLSTRCSAALRELIAENRAAIMARQFVSDRDWHFHHHGVEEFKEIQPESNNYFPQQMFPQTQ